ncbi:response regulator [Paenibacillus lautus]|uniref:response regulator n=1 Tax=Paenibacillus lautus TaxID=1401 RepID=UPI001C10E185|nr:response regulator [Paenibacillus lautus]MBU5348315.1 response regulator [Paenibacillus lautus]
MYTLLIVDDERLVVDTLAKTIPWSSIQIEYVHKAYSAEQALQFMNTQSIDIVLTDIRMPKVTGLELIEKIRELNKRTKCIIYSGYSDFEYARQAMSSEVVEYLLKPARDEDILGAVERMTQRLDEEFEQLLSLQNASATLQQNMPLLRSALVNDLIRGRKIETAELMHKLDFLQLPFQIEDRFAIMLIRLEESFANYKPESLALFEYAIANIAEETMNDHFRMVYAKDTYDYLVLIVKLSDQKAEQLHRLGSDPMEGEQQLLEQAAMKLQDNVKNFLKRSISVVVSTWGDFPTNIPVVYQECVTSMRRNVGNNTGIYITLSHEHVPDSIHSLQALYEPPTFLHLLDVGNREATVNKIHSITLELEDVRKSSQDHLMEVFFHISSAFAYAAHKNGKTMEQLLKNEYDTFLSRRTFASVKQLETWALHFTDKLFDEIEHGIIDNKTNVIQKVKQYIHDHLSEDVTLQALADQIYLHPVYLSTIFKSETGENIRDYIIRQKMEKAAWLLRHSNDKIYQICTQIGYQNPPYFIKLFKKYFAQTPQEFRENQGISSFKS